MSAFPLAPLFALFNNVFELRLDAKKLLVHHRRPVAQRVKDIGVWLGIMEGLGRIAVLTNVRQKERNIFRSGGHGFTNLRSVM